MASTSAGGFAGVMRRSRGAIALALSLVVVEYVAWIAEPGVFGPVIDAMISKAGGEADVVVWRPLTIWIGVFAVNSGIGSVRRAVDPRTYLRMFAEIATVVSQAGVEQQWPVSTTAARAELSREFITFFQYRMPEVLEQGIAIGGALVALAFYDWRIAAACGTIVLPLLVVNRLYRTRVGRLQAALHDGQEGGYDVFQTRDPARVRAHYGGLAASQQQIANYGAASFGLMRVFLLVIFLVVLYVAIDLDNLTTGRIYSVVAYIWTFVTSAEYLPELMESWTSVRDIWRRLERAPLTAAG